MRVERVNYPGKEKVYLSPRESEPVALAYAAKGIHAFVLNYSLGWDVKGFAPLGELEFEDRSTSRIMDAIRELGIGLPGDMEERDAITES